MKKSISCLYVQYAVLALNQMYKTRERKNKAELKDRKACCIKPVWIKVMMFSEKYIRGDERGGE